MKTEQEIRQWAEEALTHVPEAKAVAASKIGAMRVYADGVNDGVEVALKNLLAYLDADTKWVTNPV